MMTPEQLESTLRSLIAGWEGECVEFKAASKDCDTSDVLNRSPRRYHNRFLAEAMVLLRMIDTMGFGIR